MPSTITLKINNKNLVGKNKFYGEDSDFLVKIIIHLQPDQ